MEIEEALSRLESVKQTGDKFTARCPAHDDRQNSLSGTSENGKILLHCFAGCTFEQIMDALRTSNGQPRASSRESTDARPKFTYTQSEVLNLSEALVEEWTNGGEVARFLRSRGINKDASVALRLGATSRTFPGTGGSPALAIPLYHDDEIVGMKYRAVVKKDFLAETGSVMTGLYGRPDTSTKEILLLEGPLDVALAMSHSFNGVGIQATDIAPTKNDLKLLGSYQTVFVIGDTDRAGREAMNKWQTALGADYPEAIVRVRLGFKDIGDLYAADPVNFRSTLNAILRKSRASRDYFQPDDLLTEAELRDVDIKQPYAVETLVPRGQLSMMFGEEKNGKSLLVTYIGKCVANGVSVFGKYPTTKMAVLYLDLENTHHDLAANAALFTRVGPANLTYRTRQTGVPEMDAPGLVRYCEKFKPLIILDSQTKFTGAYFSKKLGGKGSQWNPDHMSGFFDELLNLCAAGGTILIIHHCTRDEAERYANSYMVGASVARAIAVVSEDKPQLRRVRMQGVLFRGAEPVTEHLIAFPVITEQGCFGLNAAPLSLADRILEYVKKCPKGASRNDIKNHVKGRGADKVSAIDDLIEEGRLVHGGKFNLCVPSAVQTSF